MGRTALLAVCGLALGCAAAPTGPVQEVATGVWSFSGTGDDAADHVFRVVVLPLRDGAQGARLTGVVGGAGITRIRPVGAHTLEELALAPARPGDASPAVFRWEVEGLDLAARPVRATVVAVLPRLPAQADPTDRLARARVDPLEIEAHADILFAGGRRAFATARAPLEEPVFLDDPYAVHAARDPDAPGWSGTPREPDLVTPR